MELIEYLEKNSLEFQTIYYPGAGKDFSPLELFAYHTDVKAVYYSDYGLNIKQLSLYDTTNLEILEDEAPFSLYHLRKFQNIKPQDFGKTYWGEFWHPNPASHEFGQPINAWGIKIEMICNYAPFDFIYLGTEGVGTAMVLLENKIFPNVVVLQDHSTGCNWTDFGGNDSPLYLVFRQHMPKYILTELNRNKSLWPGYEQITETWSSYSGNNHTAHSNPRALFRKVD
jgi:hypothetical protein